MACGEEPWQRTLRIDPLAGAGGEVRCFGSNLEGQLGVGPTSVTSATPIAAGIRRLGAFGNQTCAATGRAGLTNPDDALKCWGASLGEAWRLGEPQRLPAIPMRDEERATVESAVTLAAAGGRHVCVGKTAAGGGHELECLGANDRGQLGGGVEPGREVAVVLPAGAASVAAGEAHTCAALVDGRLRCWGANGRGQLGDGTVADPGVGALVAPRGR
jgi:alpha-tubulin suppressor-like RCC1 family protein